MFSRPKGIQVTLNGTYTFDATLRDDWTPQIVVPPYYRQPVHTIKIRINSIYRGTGTSDTYIGILKPIIQKELSGLFFPETGGPFCGDSVGSGGQGRKIPFNDGTGNCPCVLWDNGGREA